MKIMTVALLSAVSMIGICDPQGTLLALRHDSRPCCEEEGRAHTDYLYSNNPPPLSAWNSSTIYGPNYVEPPPAYYIIQDEYGDTTMEQIQR